MEKNHLISIIIIGYNTKKKTHTRFHYRFKSQLNTQGTTFITGSSDGEVYPLTRLQTTL